MGKKVVKIGFNLGTKMQKKFQSSLKIRQSRNYIDQLLNDAGGHVSDISELRKLAPSFYYDLFNQSGYWRVFPKPVVKKHLTHEAQTWFIRKVTPKEIKAALF